MASGSTLSEIGGILIYLNLKKADAFTLGLRVIEE
jgi:hypothetical protein